MFSLLLSEWGSRNFPSATFYLIPTRTWELLTGSLCALYWMDRERVGNNTLSGIGVLLILGPIALYDDTTRYPSLFTILPVMGATLVISYSNIRTWSYRVLSSPALVGIGLISYSAYLWHQPLFAFARIRSFSNPDHKLMASLAILSLLFAFITWKYVEAPFRQYSKTEKSGTQRIFGTFAGGAILIIFVASFLYTHKGYMEKTNPSALAEISIEPFVDFTNCDNFDAIRTGSASCRRYGEGPNTLVIWGDSHAAALAHGVVPVEGWSIFVISHNGCPPVLGVWRSDDIGNSANCPDSSATKKYAEYIRALKPEQVFLVARWTLYIEGWQKQRVMQNPPHFLSSNETRHLTADSSTSTESLLIGLRHTLEYFSTFSTVSIMKQAPDLNHFNQRQRITTDSFPEETYIAWHRGEKTLLETLQSEFQVVVFDTPKLLKQGKTYLISSSDGLLYSDDNHLSLAGARRVFLALREKLN